jgi:hypothetical protein
MERKEEETRMKEKEGNNGEHKNEMNIRSMRVDNDCQRSNSPQAAAIIGPSAPAINGGDSSARRRERGSEGGRRERGRGGDKKGQLQQLSNATHLREGRAGGKITNSNYRR